MPTFDLSVTPLREFNAALHAVANGDNDTAFEVVNPRGAHALAVGIDKPLSVDVRGSVVPLDIGPAPSWRNLRVPLDQLPVGTDAVRLVAADNDITQKQWLAVTPPRLPKLVRRARVSRS